ncbi:hypothetical protein CPC08DRAFT_824268 [Agrocybe pediades]|nr:hypothetical protein CPC08DRAFT_824268 [Agrocybe pediades]
MKFAATMITVFYLIGAIAAYPSPSMKRGVAATTKSGSPTSKFTSEELSERYFDDDFSTFDRRQAAEIAVVAAAFDLGYKIGGAIGDMIVAYRHKKSGGKRLQYSFTQTMVNDLRNRYPSYNFVACHVRHSIHFGGEPGLDWDYTYKEVDADLSSNKATGYDIYWFKQGTFKLLGESGDVNWAYAGNVTSKSTDGRTVVFSWP